MIDQLKFCVEILVNVFTLVGPGGKCKYPRHAKVCCKARYFGCCLPDIQNGCTDMKDMQLREVYWCACPFDEGFDARRSSYKLFTEPKQINAWAAFASTSMEMGQLNSSG